MSAVGAILGGSVNSHMFCISAHVDVGELFINFPPLRAFFLFDKQKLPSSLSLSVSLPPHYH